MIKVNTRHSISTFVDQMPISTWQDFIKYIKEQFQLPSLKLAMQLGGGHIWKDFKDSINKGVEYDSAVETAMAQVTARLRENEHSPEESMNETDVLFDDIPIMDAKLLSGTSLRRVLAGPV